MQVFSQEHVRMCLLKDYAQMAIKKKLADGDKELSFKYPKNGEGVKYLKNECYIVTQEDEFVLKEISTSKQYMKYKAVLNLEELQGKQFASFETIEQTVTGCLEVALQGTGWKVRKCGTTKKRTIRKDSVCTALDIIGQCISTYKVEVEYHTKEKVIDIYEQIGGDKGVYFMEAVNLRQPPSYTMTTNGFFTQLKPIGKDGLTIDIDGKDYVENYSYSKKKLMKVWKDERYTLADSLREDAELKLAEICRPTVTYDADVIDLAKASEEYKDILDYSLGDVVTLVSKTRGIKEKMRIVQIVEYPQSPQGNTCQLSTAKKTFADIQQELKAEAVEEAIGASTANALKTMDKESDNISEEVRISLERTKTEILEDVSGMFLGKGEAEEVANMAAIEAANEVKRYMDNQLENYETEAKAKRDIEESKNEILEEISRKYVTVGMMNGAVDEAKEEMDGRIKDAVEEMERSRNDIADENGTIWRLKIVDGVLGLEEVSEEE